MSAVRPMLATPFDEDRFSAVLKEVEYFWGQPKIDGMRVITGADLIPYSRSGKQWPQKQLRLCIQDAQLAHLDGEALAGHNFSPKAFRIAQSGLRAADGTGDLTWYLFDTIHPEVAYTPYANRMAYLRRDILKGREELILQEDTYKMKLLATPSEQIRSVEQAQRFMERMMEQNFEGAIFRHPLAPYKHNRATPKQCELVKLKFFATDEAVIYGYEPWYTNQNEAEQSALGYTERSSHQENLVPLERLGAYLVYLLREPSVKFKIGVFRGVTHSDRDRLWTTRDADIGSIIEFEHQGYNGGYDVPRTPIGIKFRPAIDVDITSKG